MTEERKVNFLQWLDPNSGKMLPAGVAYYNTEYGEYFLKIDEEPSEKQYFLKPSEASPDKVTYRMELVIKNKEGRFLKRQLVGDGFRDKTTNGDVHIDFGSKFKTLVLSINS